MIYRYSVLPSTMIEAARLASEGAPSGTAVVADEQTAGQGRHGHSWHSAPNDGLYVTVVLRMAELKPAITMALGVAVAAGIEEVSGLTRGADSQSAAPRLISALDLRGPYDVMIGDRKLAGVLTTFEYGAVLAGIGVNVNHREFPPEIASIATSLFIETGREHDREVLLEAILRRVTAADAGTALRDFSARSSYVSGRRVCVDMGSETVYGTTAGLDAEGFLKLRTDDGGETTIFAGGVRPA